MQLLFEKYHTTIFYELRVIKNLLKIQDILFIKYLLYNRLF